jgi:ATP-dependent protease ClpP protease subunit
MGAVILQAAAWRVVTPNTRILFHNPYVTTEGEGGMSPKDIKRLADDLKELTARNLQIIAARSRLSTRRVQSLCNKDTRMWPREAIRLNLVDAIAEVWSEPLLSLPAEKVASSCE